MTRGLIVKNDEQKEQPVPLKAVKITGNLLGEILHVNISQSFANTETENGEFIYTFPLPDEAAVCHFSALVGERKIIGKTMEKDQAYKQYEKAVTAGDSGFLLEDIRSNVYQVNLGNVKAGEAVEIEIAYLQSLKINDDELRIMVPTLVAPRYIPGKKSGAKKGMGTAAPTDQVPDADFITPPIASPDYRATINFQLNPGRKIAAIKSPSHRIKALVDQPETASIELSDQKTLLNRDFVLKVKLLGEPITRCLIGKTELNEWFAMTTFTPELPAAEHTEGAEYIFLIDISGSMGGIKLDQAKTALKICLRNLGAEDTFKLAAFESHLHSFSQHFQPYDQKHLDQATRWIDKLEDMGGTEILSAIQFALQDKPTKERIVIILTDGEVGNESEIARYVKAHNENVRLFSIGIDTSVNSLFINQIAEAGNGAAEFVYPGEEVDDKIIRHFSRIHAKSIRSLRLRFDENVQFEIAGELPEKLYDLEPCTLLARLDHGPIERFVVEGFVADELQQIEISDVIEIENPDVLAKLWARQKIAKLEQYLETENRRRADFIRNEIISLSEKYNVSSSLTSFVAIYERENKLIGLPRTAVVPVSEPADWDMDSLNQTHLNLFIGGNFALPMRRISVQSNMEKILSNVSRNIASASLTSADEPIKRLAASQNFDGSFGDLNHDQSAVIIETIKAVAQFLTGGIDLQPYRGQMTKALHYLLARETEILQDETKSIALYLILQTCQQTRGFNRIVLPEVVEKFRMSLSQSRAFSDLTSKHKSLDSQLKQILKELK